MRRRGGTHIRVPNGANAQLMRTAAIRPFRRDDDGGGEPAKRVHVIIGIGQSLMAGRGGGIVQTAGANGASDLMAVGGATNGAMDFFSTNEEFAPNRDEWASLATFAEGGEGQSPLAGVTNTLSIGQEELVLFSGAIGGRDILTLHSTFPQVAAAVERSVDLLLASGYATNEIGFIFAMKHGEADATKGTSQADYEKWCAQYIDRCREAAAQALRDPTYIAPLHVTFPVQQAFPDAMRTIKKAILNVIDGLVGDVYYGPVWQVPINPDRTHPTLEGYVLGGEVIGYDVTNKTTPMRCMSVSLAGSTFTATFNKPAVRDTSLGLAGELNATNALDGLEFWDGAAYVQITNLDYAGSTVTGTLASAPAGGELRIASQDTTSTLTANLALHPGCSIRSTDAGWASTFDPSYTHLDWCIPQIVEVT